MARVNPPTLRDNLVWHLSGRQNHRFSAQDVANRSHRELAKLHAGEHLVRDDLTHTHAPTSPMLLIPLENCDA